MFNLRFPHLAACAAILVVAIAGCGSSSSGNSEASKSPEQILSDAKAATTSAKSVHVAGQVKESGTPIALDLQLTRGNGGKGSLTVNGSPVQVVRTGSDLYMKGDKSFYSKIGASSSAQALLAGRWLKAPITGADAASFVALTDISKLFNRLLTTQGQIEKGGTSTINGQPVVALVDKSNNGRLYVSTSGKPYPVKATGSSGELAFTNWDAPVSVSPPANSIDISKLNGG